MMHMIGPDQTKSFLGKFRDGIGRTVEGTERASRSDGRPKSRPKRPKGHVSLTRASRKQSIVTRSATYALCAEFTWTYNTITSFPLNSNRSRMRSKAEREREVGLGDRVGLGYLTLGRAARKGEYC